MNLSAPLAVGRQAEIFPWGEGRVLKLFRYNHPDAAQWEYSISRLAYEGGTRTPQPFEVITVEGRPAIVYERVEGGSMLQQLGKRPWLVTSMAKQFAELHHTVHRCQAPGMYAARPAIERVIQSRDELSAPVKAVLLKRLAQLPDGDSLLHGDFHPDNVMLGPAGLVIVDWPNAAKGCPVADVARTTITLMMGAPLDPSPMMRVLIQVLRSLFHRTYLNAYFAHSPYRPVDLQLWEPILAAQRLRDEISGEAERLVKFIEVRLSNLE